MVAAIEVSGISKRFGQVQAVDGVDLAVTPGTVYGLLGPNGAGTTTVGCGSSRPSSLPTREVFVPVAIRRYNRS